MNHDLPRPDHLAVLPVAVLLVQSSCNCRCAMCDIWRDRSRQELPLDQICSYLVELRGLATREVALSGGEPLMHSRIESIGRAVKAQGFQLTLLTTGLLLRRHAGWIAECVDRVYVSLDGPEPIHNGIRNIPDAYARVTRGITTLRDRNPDLYIGGRCTVQRLNFRYLADTVTSAHQLGLDSISFLGADVNPGAFGRSGDEPARDLAVGVAELPLLRQSLDQLYAGYAGDFDNAYIVESRERLERKLYDYYRALAGQGAFPSVRCNAPWVSTVIEVDGAVRPCFFHPAYTGDSASEPLTRILNSEAARGWRGRLDLDSNPVCRTCVCTLALPG